MASEKIYTPQEAARAVLKKAHEILKENELKKSEKLEKKYEGFKAVEESAKKSGASDPAAVAAAVGRKKYGKEAFQHAAAEGKKMGKSEEGKKPYGPKETYPEKTDKAYEPEKDSAPKQERIQEQANPGKNPKEEAEGNNPLAGTTPTQVGKDGKNIPGGDEIRGYLKLAKFIGRMGHKREMKSAIAGKSAEMDKAETGHEKGVHQELERPGTSSMGNKARGTSFHEAPNGNRINLSMPGAKDEAKANLAQQKKMPKPKLPG